MSEMNLLDSAYEEVAEEVTAEVVETKVEETTEAAEEPVKTETKTEDSTTESKTEVSDDKKTDKPDADPRWNQDSWQFSQAMDERDKRQKFQKENETLRQQIADQKEPEDEISVFDDETGYKQQQDAKMQTAVNDVALNMSQAFAEEAFGEDKVAEAIDWFKTEGAKSAFTVNQFNASKLPFHKLVSMHNEDKDRRNPDEFKARLKAEIMAELKGEEKTEESPAITSSLASSPSASEITKVEDMQDILGD